MSLLVATVAVAFLALTMAPPAAASSVYVVGPGGGLGICASPPYQTISGAISAAEAGDTIIVCPGTYDEAVTVGKALTLQGMPGAIIRPSALTDTAVLVTSDDVVVESLEVDGGGAEVHYGIFAYNANRVTVRDNVVHDMTNNPGDYGGTGILYYSWGQPIGGGRIEGNTVYNTPRMGIFVGGQNAYWPWLWLISVGNSVLDNNVYSAWQGPTYDYGAAIQLNGAADSVVEGNIVHQTGYPSTAAYHTADIYLLGSGPGNSISRNHVHHNHVGIMLWTESGYIDYGAYAATDPAMKGNKLHHNDINIWEI